MGSRTRTLCLAAAPPLVAGAFVLAPLVAWTFAPVVALFVLLLLGRRPGERTLLRLRAARLRVRRARRPRPAPPRLPDVVRPVGHGRCWALAVRPPPAAAA